MDILESINWDSVAVPKTITTKLFYGKYAYKAVYLITGANCLTKKITAIDNKFTYVNKYYQKVPLNDEDIKILTILYNTYLNGKYKFRIESNTVSIFSESEQELYNLVTDELNSIRNHLRKISLPNPESLTSLDVDTILVKGSTDYSYRLDLREGMFKNFTERNTLANYLRQCGEDVKCTEKFFNDLRSTNKYLKLGYFYVRDPNLVSMIYLIMPKLVRRVYRLVVI